MWPLETQAWLLLFSEKQASGRRSRRLSLRAAHNDGFAKLRRLRVARQSGMVGGHHARDHRSVSSTSAAAQVEAKSWYEERVDAFAEIPLVKQVKSEVKKITN